VEHSCQFIVDFHTEPGEDGDPIFCDAPASIKHDGAWLCAEHYDEVIAYSRKGSYIYRQGGTFHNSALDKQANS
jgi:hypothetical protein